MAKFGGSAGSDGLGGLVEWAQLIEAAGSGGLGGLVQSAGLTEAAGIAVSVGSGGVRSKTLVESPASTEPTRIPESAEPGGVLSVPAQLDDAAVRFVAALGVDQRNTGATWHSVGVDHFAYLAIATYAGDRGWCLFYCSAEWEVLTDTYHDSLDEAIAQADFEFTGLTFTPRP